MDVEECFCECGNIFKNVDLIKLICFHLIVFNRKIIFKKIIKIIFKNLKIFGFIYICWNCTPAHGAKKVSREFQ